MTEPSSTSFHCLRSTATKTGPISSVSCRFQRNRSVFAVESAYKFRGSEFTSHLVFSVPQIIVLLLVLKCTCMQVSLKAISFKILVFHIFMHLKHVKLWCRSRLRLSTKDGTNTSAKLERGISPSANENQVISMQYGVCITRHSGRLAAGKMITLHNVGVSYS